MFVSRGRDFTCTCRRQVAEEVFTLARVVRTFGTEGGEVGRYARNLGRLRRISVRLATAYLLYLVTNASLFNLTKARPDPDPNPTPYPAAPGEQRKPGQQ